MAAATASRFIVMGIDPWFVWESWFTMLAGCRNREGDNWVDCEMDAVRAQISRRSSMSKKETRKRLASLSFSEKVKILEKLRDRSLALAACGLRREAA